MLRPFSFLSRIDVNRRASQARKLRARHRDALNRVMVEELEPRTLPAHRLLQLPEAVPGTGHLRLVGQGPHTHPARSAARAVLLVPGLPGQTDRVRFTWTAGDASFQNELGLFLVDDASGRIGRLRPGDHGYAAAALAPRRSRVIFASGTAGGATRSLLLPAGRFFALYLIQNGTTAAFRARNPGNLLGDLPVALFSFVRANPDLREHLRWRSGSAFGWSDGGGSAPDFGNLVARVTFGRPEGAPRGLPPVPAVPAPASPPPAGTALPVVTTPAGPAAPRFDLAPTSATGTSPHTTSDARVTLVGQTAPGAAVELLATGDTTVASETGAFQFPGVSLPLGDTALTVRATDQDGASTDATLTLHRVPASTTGPNAVLVWNQNLLQAIQLDDSAPPVASRAMAMVQGAVLDAVNAIDGTPARFVHLAPAPDASPNAAVAGAAYRVLSYLYPAQQASLDQELTSALQNVPDGQARTDGLALGKAAGDGMIALRANDGSTNYVDYTPGSGPGVWQPTPPAYDNALLPQWATLQPFAMTSDSQFRPAGPPALDSQAWATAVNEVQSIGRADSTTRTADQTQIARFWADGGGSYTPPGHWNTIAQTVAQQAGDSLADDARLFAVLDTTMADAAIVAWDAKYAYNAWRPITAIQNADTAGNPAVQADPTWTPLLITPNFPEYVSGHSTFSGAAATVLDAFFGTSVSFTSTTPTLLGVTRSFTSFDQAAAEAGQSRIYAGIHFQFSNQDGLAAGRALGKYVLSTFDLSADTQPPQIFIHTPSQGAASATNPTIVGQVLDNLSGVAKLEYAVDDGDFAPLAFDSEGSFQVTTALALDGSADSDHVVQFRATDAAGNVSDPVPISFTLDTAAPTVTVTSPPDGGNLAALATLHGTADGGGSAVTRLTYRFDAGTEMPVAFDPSTGQFSPTLDLSRLTTGPHTLTVTASNAAGLTGSTTVHVNLPALIPFTVPSTSPMDGAQDVGVTFRPQVFFSRPVDATTLTADDFYATDPSGAKLPATIVPAADGSFAWLFFTNPLPGGSMITLHVDGSAIKALADGALLDADGSGKPGSVQTISFTTVSLTPMTGTSLSGKVLDPGPDLQPGTFDDVRAGPNHVLHTAEDVFLNPLAGVKVYILGMENQAVLTDAQGNFHFDSVPAGDVKLAIEGTTATNAPAGLYFPEMVMDLNLQAGQANTPMGSMGTPEEEAANQGRPEVYLPRIQTSVLHDVSGTAPVHIALDPTAAPDLTPQQQSQLQLTVQPGSAIGMDGKPMTDFQMGVSTVPPALVREMLPAGVMQHTFDITIQAPGVATFTTPATITFPNVFNAAPGTQMNFLSFDHTTGRLEIDGTATVSADGLSVTTDPGNGITHPGWHGLAPMGSPTAPVCDGPPTILAPVVPDLHDSVKDFLFTSPTQTAQLEFSNDAGPLAGNVCGKANTTASQLEVVIDFAPTALQFLKLVSGQGKKNSLHQDIKLQPGAPYTIPLVQLPKDISKLTTDQLFGTHFTITVNKIDPGTAATKSKPVVTNLMPAKTYYIYRLIDASDDNSADSALKFPDTFNDGTGGITHTRAVAYLGNPADMPTLTATESGSTNPSTQFNVQTTMIAGKPGWNLVFDPQETQDHLTAQLVVTTPGPNPREVVGPGVDALEGNGVTSTVIYLNEPAFKEDLAQLAKDVSPVTVELIYQNAAVAPGAPPTYFQLSVAGLGKSGLIPVGAGDSAVRSALEQIPGIGTGGVDVSSKSISLGDHTTQVTYTITPDGNFANVPTPEFQVLQPAGQDVLLQQDAARAFPAGILTQNQVNLFTTPDEPDQFFQSVLVGIDQYFQQVQPAVLLSPDAPPTANDFSIEWLLGSKPGSPGSYAYGLTPAILGPDLLGKFVQGVKDMPTKLNSTQEAFRVAQILGDSRRLPSTPDLPHAVYAYLNKLLGPSADIPGDASGPLLTYDLSQILAHEIGHTLGLPHTAKMDAMIKADEVQKITLVSGGSSDTFTLSYGGATTVALSLNPKAPAASGLLPATAANVQKALLALPGLGGSDLKVTGPFGGPYTVFFVDPSLSGEAAKTSRFRRVNVPQITVTASVSSIVTATTEGGIGGYFARNQAKIGSSQGKNDIMLDVGLLPPGGSFLPGLSLTLLRLSLGLNWNQTDGKQAVGAVSQEFDIGTFGKEVLSDDTGSSAPDPDAFGAAGPALTVLDSNGLLATDETTDFGIITAGGAGGAPATQQFTLDNIGTVPAALRNVTVTGSSAFSVSPVPAGTVLQPGDTLTVTVAFAPQAGGPFSGTLVIDSDTSNIPSTVDLTGTGQSSTGSISLGPWDNNVGGVQVGQAEAGSVNNFTEPTVVNTGAAPLTITGIRVATGHGQGEYQVDPTLRSPVVVQPGASFSFIFSFQPSALGLRPGAFEVLSDDPQTPVLRIPVVGTGVTANETPSLANDYVAVENDIDPSAPVVLRQRTDSMGNWNFYLTPNTPFYVTIFDPTTDLVSHGAFFTSPSGVPTQVVVPQFVPSDFEDTVGNGLPDDIQFAIGLNPNKVSTNGDGISDFDKLAMDIDPLAGQPAATGVVGALQLPGDARALTVAADPNTGRPYAYVAGSGGLSVVDVTKFNKPVVVGQLRTPAAATDVDVDPTRQLAAAAFGSGLALVNVADPTRPVTLQTVPVNASLVRLYDGVAYVAVGTDVRALDATTGEDVQDLPLGKAPLASLARDGTLLLTLATDGTLSVIDLSGPAMVLRGTLAIPGYTVFENTTNCKLFAADGTAWIADDLDLFTVDYSQPDHPKLLRDVNTAGGSTLNLQGRVIALSGSGLGLAGGSINGFGEMLRLIEAGDTVDLPGKLLASFPLPDFVQGIAIAGGLGYIADGKAGLQIVNYLPFDQGTTPPTVQVAVPVNADIDPTTPGIQVLEATPLTLVGTITDDVQVRDVQLLMNGAVVKDDLSYPYDLTFDLPRIKDAGSQVVLQVAATDTGGTTTLSAPIDLQLVPDTTPPAIVKLTPADGSIQPLSLHTVTIQFSKSLDPATVTADDFSLVGPGGAVTPLTFSLRTRQTVVELNYLPLAAGNYQLVIHAAAIKDLVGNALGAADLVKKFTLTSGSPPPTITWVNPNGGFWDDPTNWSTGAVPGPNDHVGITIPVTAPIVFRQGPATINSLFSTDPFQITDGALYVQQTAKVNNQFLITHLAGAPTIFGGTVLRGDGGQGVTIEGFVTLAGATVQTDMTLDKQGTILHLADDFTLLGTATVANSDVQIVFDTSDRPDGAETIFAGTFASQNDFPLQMTATYNAKVTFDKDVTIQAQGGSIQDPGDTLDLVNQGTILSVNANAASGVDPFTIDTGSMENDGVLEATNGGGLVIVPVNWTNLPAGKIIDDHGYLTLGRGNSSLVPAGWSNAGTITATGNDAELGSVVNPVVVVFQSSRSPWSNTGTISLTDVHFVDLGGQFTSAAVQGLQRSGGVIGITGLMDNTGRTFTFNDSTGSWVLSGGLIRGGTINVNPAANDTLDIGGGTFDGVAVNGDLELGGPSHQPAEPGNVGGGLVVVNGFALNGTMRIDNNAHNYVSFQGTQTVSQGTFLIQHLPDDSDTFLGQNLTGEVVPGVVTLGPNVVIESSAHALIGGLVIQGRVTQLPSSTSDISALLLVRCDNQGMIDVKSNTLELGLQDCDNQGTIHVEANADLQAVSLKNEGTITADNGATVLLAENAGGGFHNSGTINVTNATVEFGGQFLPADIPTINGTGGSIRLVGTLENAGNTFVIDATNSPWFLDGGLIQGGTVQVATGGDLRGLGGALQDVTVDGDINAVGVLGLVGDVTINGTVTGALILDSQTAQQQNLPLVIHAGTFNVDSGGIQGVSNGSGTVTFGPGVTMTGGFLDAVFPQPLLNEGIIKALSRPGLFTIDYSVVTNQGTLSAASLATLQINHLGPNAGTISPDAGGTLAIGGDLAETAAGTIAVTQDGTGPASNINGLAAQYSQVTVAGAATLDGTLTIQLGPGYQPNVGDTFPILTYASHTGTFATVNAPALPNGRSFQVVYGAEGVSLVVVQNQLAASVPPPGAPAARLTVAQARTVLDAAIQLWAADGVGPAALARMRGVDLRVADLGGNHLAEYDGRAITLDGDADGFGWFVDPTPLVNEEFRRDAVDSAFTALANGPAAGHMDLLTVLAHELGHVIGLDDDVPGSPGDLMSETLAAGVRRLPG
jgi:hypothetical protein